MHDDAHDTPAPAYDAPAAQVRAASAPPGERPDPTEHRLLGSLSRRGFLAGMAGATAVVTTLDLAGTAPAARAETTVPDPVPLPLEWSFDGISTPENREDGDFDGGGHTFPAEAFPTGSALVAGIPFEFPASYDDGEPNFLPCEAQTLELEPAAYAALFVIGTAYDGDVDATAKVTYETGDVEEVPLQITDWAQRPDFGESIAVQAPHRHSRDSAADPVRVAVFLQTLALDPTRVARSITLPDESRAMLMAMSLQPAVEGAAVRPLAAESTDLFVGTEEDPQQIARIDVLSVGTEPVTSSAPAVLSIEGEGVSTPETAQVDELGIGERTTVDIGLVFDPMPEAGTEVTATATATVGEAAVSQEVQLRAEEPGWTVYMVNHFHYDSVWWNTQGAYTETWQSSDASGPALSLTQRFLERAQEDPEFRFVLAELDYLKPYWGFRPQDRGVFSSLIEEGRLEIVGGSYNEPNPNLTSAELTIRNLIHGMEYQSRVLGGTPESAWQLDVFGHDAQFPGLCADAGLTSSAWARGPFHGGGPGDPHQMQFPTEFDWVSPSGRSVLTHYMAEHYSNGWDMNGAGSLEEAQEQVYDVFQELRIGAATKNCLMMVGSDFTPPNKWVTDIHRTWPERYVWPKFVSATAKEFFDAVRADTEESGHALSPQTRDMNPVFTGKDVTYIDTKQANREAENTLMAAEKFATIAALNGAAFPHEAIDKAWRQLCFTAHHDAITGTMADQVYVDLVTAWREAHDLAAGTLDAAQKHLVQRIDTSGDGTAIVVFNPVSWERTDICTAEVAFEEPGPKGVQLWDADGKRTDVHVESFTRHEDGTLRTLRIAFRATVPGTGYATFHLAHRGPQVKESTWKEARGRGANNHEISNDRYSVRVDPARGGAISAITDLERNQPVLREGGLANELLMYDEYGDVPGDLGNPWVLGQKGGPVAESSSGSAEVTVQECPIGSRLTVRTEVAGVDVTQRITLWEGIDRIDCSTDLDGFEGLDRLVRVRFQSGQSGAMPVSETANATLGRSCGFPDDDVHDGNPWTLDFSALNWFDVGTTLRFSTPSGASRAVSVGEVVVPSKADYATARTLLTALVRRGVTATTSLAEAPRYGALPLDSNLPDTRIAVGGPEDNAFVEQVLAEAPDGYREEFDRQLADAGSARVLVPAAESFADTWVPNADVRGTLDLPVLIIAGTDAAGHRAAMESLAEDLDAAPEVVVEQPEALDGTLGTVSAGGFAVINRGIPSFNVDKHGSAHLNLLRAPTKWPSGAWTDGPRSALPDGSHFMTQHWSHRFDYSLVPHGGDWREAGLVQTGHEVNNPLGAQVTEPSDGEWPARWALLTASPASAVITALKPAGNGAAAQGEPGEPIDGVALRLYEAHGEATEATVSMVGGLTGARRTSLLEGDGEELSTADGVRVPLGGFDVATVVATPSSAQRTDPSAAPLGPAAEPVQPVYAEYWRHNTGTAPIGNQPVTVRLAGDTEGDGPWDLTVRLSSERTAGDAEASVTMILPEGWAAEPAERSLTLAPGQVESWTVRVDPQGAEPGRYAVSAHLTDEVVGEQESARWLIIGDVDTESPALTVEQTTEEVRLMPGGTGTVAVDLTNTTGAQLRGHAHLVSPWGTWEETPEREQGFSIDAGQSTTLEFPVEAGTRAGSWWATVKVMCFGTLRYTMAVPVIVTEDPLFIEVDDLVISRGGTTEATLRIGSIGEEGLAGTARLEVPDGWEVDPAEVEFGPLEAGESVLLPVTVTAPGDAEETDHALTAVATAGDLEARATASVRVLPQSVEFTPGSPDEAFWMWDPGASVTQPDLRFADDIRFWIYRFPLPTNTASALLTLTMDNQFLVEVSTDGETWTEVLREEEHITDSSNAGDYEVDLSEHITEDSVLFVRFSDSFPEDGWGVRLFKVVLDLA